MDLSVIIPAYNEQQRLAPTLRALDAQLAGEGLDYEILVVDDGSTDQTVALVEEARRRMPRVRCLATSPNRGKGHAVRVGMLAARGALRVMYDADGSIPAAEVPRLLAPILRGQVDIAIGSRYVGGACVDVAQPRWRRLWSRLANRIVRRTLAPGIRDTQCGLKAFSAEAAAACFSRAQIDGWAFDLEVLALARRLGYGVVELGVRCRDDRRTRVNPARDLIRVVREWLAIRRNFRRGAYGPLALQPAAGAER
jgi:dolichyl-phosphate beta-glucosyltransferase